MEPVLTAPISRSPHVLAASVSRFWIRLSFFDRHVDARRTRAVRHAHREMHYRPGRFADTCGVFDADPAELPDQNLLHLEPDVGGIAVTGQIDETRDEVGERIGSHEQQRAPPRTEVDDGLDHVEKFLGGQREQFRTWNGLDDVEQQLAGMARVALR